jgi:hypothetical protein
MLIIVFFIHETLHVAERTKLFLCSLFFVLCPPPPYNTHAVPFTVAPTPLQIQAAIDHQEAKRREKENSMSTAFHMKASRLGGRREVEDDASSQSSYSNDGEESVSSVGSGSTGGASSGTERSRNRLVTQLRRAHHDTPFMAGGRVFYAPRRPHTRGSRNLTGMELEVMPLVTGARESVEHATSLESPRRAAHPSWTPHVELEPHPTFGKKYHGHHLHVHHHEGGHGGHKSGKDPGEDDDDPHAHKHHHHHHKHHHHHHHHGKGGHKRGRPKTLKECILSHETDVKVLSEAYRAEAMKFPPSWKQAADEAAAAAQQVIVHKTETKAPVVEVQRAHGSHHNVYATEAHGKPPGTHRNLQNLVIQAKKSANNKTLARFKARSYKKVLALQIQKQSAAQLAERKRMNRKCQDLTAKHAELIVMGRRSQARRDQQSRQTARELQEFLREGRRPTTSFSKPIVQPGFPSAQKRGGSGRGMGQRPQTTTPGQRRSVPAKASKTSQASSTLIPQPPKRRPGSSVANGGRSWRSSPRASSAMGYSTGYSGTCSISPRDVLNSTREVCRVSSGFNARWLKTSGVPDNSRKKRKKKQRPATAAAGGSLSSGGRGGSNTAAEEVAAVSSDIEKFERNEAARHQDKLESNFFRFRSGASKKVRNIKMRKMMKAFGV